MWEIYVRQISEFFENIFLKKQYGFKRGYRTQHYILAMLESRKTSVDKGKVFGVLLTDLSKAFDCLEHNLFIAKKMLMASVCLQFYY